MASEESPNLLLGRVNGRAREEIARWLTPVQLASGQVLYDPGDPIEHVYFVEDGLVSVVAVLSDGSSVETMTVGYEGIAGVAALVGTKVSFGRTLAQSPARASRIDASRLRAIVDENPKLRDLMERYAGHMMAEAQQTAACNARHTLEPRLAKWLLRSHDRTVGDELQLTQEFLADMLGAQRTTVTHVAGNLQAAGLIRHQRGRVEVLNRKALERTSCECYRLIQRRCEEVGLPAPARA